MPTQYHLSYLRWLNSLKNALIAQSVGSYEPLPVADEGEVRTGKNKEYHERTKRSETTMFLTVTRVLKEINKLALIAQSVEHAAVNRGVTGSSPV